MLCQMSLSSDARTLPQAQGIMNSLRRLAVSSHSFSPPTLLHSNWAVSVSLCIIHSFNTLPLLFDEFHLHSVSSTHTHTYTLNQCFSYFHKHTAHLGILFTCRFCFSRSEAWALRLLISRISWWCWCGWSIDHPLSIKTLYLIITWNCSTSTILENLFGCSFPLPASFCMQNKFLELKLPSSLTPRYA